MFLRFETLRRDPFSRAPCGIFFAAEPVLAAAPGRWEYRELRRELLWFNLQLAAPDRLVVYARARGRGNRSGVCWFRGEAAEHVARARYVAWLLGELGLPVRERRARAPGTVIWEDAHQVVALADPRTARG